MTPSPTGQLLALVRSILLDAYPAAVPESALRETVLAVFPDDEDHLTRSLFALEEAEFLTWTVVQSERTKYFRASGKAYLQHWEARNGATCRK